MTRRRLWGPIYNLLCVFFILDTFQYCLTQCPARRANTDIGVTWDNRVSSFGGPGRDVWIVMVIGVGGDDSISPASDDVNSDMV